MKINTSAALLFSLTLLGAGSIFAQTTATTVPVGFISLNFPAGTVPAPSTTTLSAPLLRTAEFSGVVASIDSATQLTLSGATWGGGAYAGPTAPYMAKVMTGASVGRFFLITANTANRVTLDLSTAPALPGATLVGNVTVGDSVQIIPLHTLGTLFGNSVATLPANWVAATVKTSATQVWILSNPATSTWTSYYFHSTANAWRSVGTIAQTNTVLYPDDGLMVLHVGANPVAFTVMGTVPSTGERTDVGDAGSVFTSTRFPVDVTLLNTGIHSLPGWLKSTTASTSDNVWLWNPLKAGGPGWDTYFYHSTANMWRSVGLLNQGGTVIPAGTGILLTRRVPAAGSTTLAQTLPYTP